MSLARLWTSYRFELRELLRTRIGLLLLFVIPLVFYYVVHLTTTEESIDFVISSVSEEVLIGSTSRGLSLVFTGVACVGFITAFLALTMSQRDAEVNRRLVLCGYRASEIVLAKVGVLLTTTAMVGVWVAAVMMPFFRPANWMAVALGFVLAGYVYGAYGLLVGSLCRRQLEGILLVVLLANIDAGWLQNPVYYTAAQNTALIRRLPAFYPSQVALVSAFAPQASFVAPLTGSVVYGAVLLGAALLCFSLRMHGRLFRS